MKRLKDLKTREVSLVPQGANGKRFAVVKEHVEPSRDRGVVASIKNVVKAFGKKPDPKPAPTGNPQQQPKPGHDPSIQDTAAAPELTPQAQTALEAVGRILAPHKEEITDGHVDAIQAAVGIPSAGEGQDDGAGSGEDQNEGEEGDVKPEHLKEASDAAEKAFNQRLSKLGYAKYPETKLTMKGNLAPSHMDSEDGDDGDDDEEDEMEKEAIAKAIEEAVAKAKASFDEAIQKSASDNAAALKAANERADKLEKALLSQAENGRKIEIATIAKEFVNVGVDYAQTVLELADKDVTKAADGTTKFDTILKGLRSQEAMAKESKLFSVLGSPQSDIANGAQQDIMAKIAKGGETVVQKNANGEPITKEQAEADFLNSPEGQRLYAVEKARRQNAHPLGA